jgi:hypothetical protein
LLAYYFIFRNNSVSLLGSGKPERGGREWMFLYASLFLALKVIKLRKI